MPRCKVVSSIYHWLSNLCRNSRSWVEIARPVKHNCNRTVSANDDVCGVNRVSRIEFPMCPGSWSLGSLSYRQDDQGYADRIAKARHRQNREGSKGTRIAGRPSWRLYSRRGRCIGKLETCGFAMGCAGWGLQQSLCSESCPEQDDPQSRLIRGNP
jgi:hypothetical protein